MQNIDAVFAVRQNVIDHLFALSSDERIDFVLGKNPNDEKEFLSSMVEMRELNSFGNIIITISNGLLISDHQDTVQQIEVNGNKDGLWVINPDQSKKIFFKLISYTKEQFKQLYDESPLKYKYGFNELWYVWNCFRDVCYASVKNNAYTLVKSTVA